ncbi:MAG: hypothetical protein U0586_03980 [Candidatus Brocadiaceae bacterium]
MTKARHFPQKHEGFFCDIRNQNLRQPLLAQLSRNQFSCESGKIASEKTLAMTLTMHFNGARHLVIASGAKQSFHHKQM